MDGTPIFARGDAIFLLDGTLLRTHSGEQCVGNFCSIHNPSDHPLRDAPQLWDGRFKAIYRLCTHGHVHIDVDDFTFKVRSALPPAVLALISVHDCDGCCHWPRVDNDEVMRW